MSPASYLTAPPRVADRIIAALSSRRPALGTRRRRSSRRTSRRRGCAAGGRRARCSSRAHEARADADPRDAEPLQLGRRRRRRAGEHVERAGDRPASRPIVSASVTPGRRCSPLPPRDRRPARRTVSSKSGRPSRYRSMRALITSAGTAPRERRAPARRARPPSPRVLEVEPDGARVPGGARGRGRVAIASLEVGGHGHADSSGRSARRCRASLRRGSARRPGSRGRRRRLRSTSRARGSRARRRPRPRWRRPRRWRARGSAARGAGHGSPRPAAPASVTSGRRDGPARAAAARVETPGDGEADARAPPRRRSRRG